MSTGPLTWYHPPKLIKDSRFVPVAINVRCPAITGNNLLESENHAPKVRLRTTLREEIQGGVSFLGDPQNGFWFSFWYLKRGKQRTPPINREPQLHRDKLPATMRLFCRRSWAEVIVVPAASSIFAFASWRETSAPEDSHKAPTFLSHCRFTKSYTTLKPWEANCWLASYRGIIIP